MKIAALSFRSDRRARVAGAVGHVLLGWIGRRILTRAIDELRAMDDRTLADIGLERSEIEAASRIGRRWLQRSMTLRHCRAPGSGVGRL